MSFFQKNCYFGFSKTIAEFDHLCLKTIAPATDDSNLQWLENKQARIKIASLIFGNFVDTLETEWRRGGLVVSALDSRSSGPGSSPGRGHCIMFLGKTL